MPGEIMYVLEQKRLVPGGSILTPNKVYVTTHRIIFLDPRWLGLKAEIIDVACEDISNIQLRRGVFSTAIRIHSRFLGEEIKPPAVSKSKAKAAFAFIQKMHARDKKWHSFTASEAIST